MNGSAACRSIDSRKAHGFTLLELVVVIVICAIIVGFATMFLTTPMDAYFAQSRRSELAESSDSITRRTTEDLRRALPNSVRISNAGTRSIIELLLVEEVAFYRDTGKGLNAAQEFNFGPGETQFHALGQFGNPPPPPPRPTLILPASVRLAIGNEGTPGHSAYQGTNVMTSGTQIQLDDSGTPGEDLVTLTPAVNFAAPVAAPSNRVFLVSGPVTYICNSAANARTLRRYENYAIANAMPANEATARLNAAGVVNTVVARDVTSCQVSCELAGNPCRGGLVLDMTVSRAANAGTDEVRVLVQAPMDNRP